MFVGDEAMAQGAKSFGLVTYSRERPAAEFAV